MKFAFETKRLRVFEGSTIPVPKFHIGRRVVYIAFRHDIDCPYPVCVFTVHPDFGMMGNYAEMIETNVLHRREGFARELWYGVEKHRGQKFHGSDATPEGAFLLDSLKRWTQFDTAKGILHA